MLWLYGIPSSERHMEAMLKARDLPQSVMSELPEHGYMYFEGDRPVAAGFLRRCEKGLAMLDNYISSPGEASELRDKAFDLITATLIEDAKRFEITTLLAFSLDRNVIIRAMKHGFVATPHIMTMMKV